MWRWSKLSKNKNKEIKNVNIIFENLEIIVIPIDYIGSIVIRKITNNFVYATNSLKYKVAEYFRMTISDKFNMTIVDENYGERNSFKRIIDYNDIVAIEIEYDDKSTDTIYVDWCELDEYSNLNQATEILEDGSLLLTVTDDNNEEEKIAILEANLKSSYEETDDEKDEDDE